MLAWVEFIVSAEPGIVARIHLFSGSGSGGIAAVHLEQMIHAACDSVARDEFQGHLRRAGTSAWQIVVEDDAQSFENDEGLSQRMRSLVKSRGGVLIATKRPRQENA